MDEEFKYVLLCSKCSFKRFSNGNDVGDLVLIRQSKFQSKVPKYDYREKKTVNHPEKNRMRMYKCPKCGFTLKAFKLADNQEIGEDSDE